MKVVTETKKFRLTGIIFTVLALVFVVFILSKIEPPFLVWLLVLLISVGILVFNLNMYFFSWNLYAGKNVIKIEGFFRKYVFENVISYSIENAGVFSVIFCLYSIRIDNKTFWFFYRKETAFSLNANAISNEIEMKISKGSSDN